MYSAISDEKKPLGVGVVATPRKTFRGVATEEQ